jgi:hypothetical protein
MRHAPVAVRSYAGVYIKISFIAPFVYRYFGGEMRRGARSGAGRVWYNRADKGILTAATAECGRRKWNEHVDMDKQSNQADEAQGTECVQFDEFLANAAALFDEAASGKRITVERNGERFRLVPMRRRSGTRGRRKPRHFTLDDPLWGIVGIARSRDPNTDVSSNKHKYLADAYADLHEENG